MRILNLTQHLATPEQVEAGVVEPADKALVQQLLTFDELPSIEEIQRRSVKLLDICRGYTYVMLGGAPYLMGTLEGVLIDHVITPVYAYSKRVSVEQVVDGVVTKSTVFKHIGFVGLD